MNVFEERSFLRLLERWEQFLRCSDRRVATSLDQQVQEWHVDVQTDPGSTANQFILVQERLYTVAYRLCRVPSGPTGLLNYRLSCCSVDYIYIQSNLFKLNTFNGLVYLIVFIVSELLSASCIHVLLEVVLQSTSYDGLSLFVIYYLCYPLMSFNVACFSLE